MGPNTNTQANPVATPAAQRPRAGGGCAERPAGVSPAEQPRRNPPAAPAPANPTDRTDPSATAPAAPVCPACGKAMLLRTARKGPRAGSQFWGCTGYPECRKTLAI